MLKLSLLGGLVLLIFNFKTGEAAGSEEDACGNASVLQLPFGNVTLDHVWFPEGKQQTFVGPTARGIKLRLGDSQTFACQLQPEDTRIFIRTSKKTCHSDDDNQNCMQQVQYGGLLEYDERTVRYDPEDTLFGMRVSGRRNKLEIEASNGTAKNLDKIIVDDFAFLTNDDPAAKSNRSCSLGMASSSPFTAAFRKDRWVTSNTWGFFSGWTGVTTDTIQDGALVLGGYDAGKIDAPFTSFPINSRQCTHSVFLKEIKMFGRTVNKLGSSGEPVEIWGCVDPRLNGLYAPEPLYEAILETLNGIVSETSASSASFKRLVAGIHEGGLSIPNNIFNQLLQDLNLSQFDSGMSVITKDVEAEFSIPIHQLVQPARTLGRNGYMFLNNNIDTAMISIYQTRAEIADDIVLGLPFLSSNYMFVNNENQTFSLAPVKRRVSSGSTDIIPVLPSVDCGKTDLPTETGSSDPSTQTGDQAGSDFRPENRLGTGAIAGIVIGAIIGIILISICAFFIIRRRILRDPPLPGPPDTQYIYLDKGGNERHELEGGYKAPPTELIARLSSTNSDPESPDVPVPPPPPAPRVELQA